jgi:hypothetical protein
MTNGIDFGRRLARAQPLQPYFVTENQPGAQMVGDGLYDYARRNAGTEFHPLGTCSMLPRDHGGVVDTNLMVYGSANLRVIDASIMPLQISAHLMASVYGIAEKGADIIKQRHWAVRTNGGSGNGNSSSTARPGVATDGAVTAVPSTTAGTGSGAAGAGSAGSSPLSQGATIGIGVGAGVGGAIILAAIIAFFCFRKKKNAQAAGEKGWYEPAAGADGAAGGGNGNAGGYGHDAYAASAAAGGRYREPGYAMNDMSPPMAAFATRKMSASPSVSSRGVEEMAGREPLRTNSGYGFGGEGYRDSTDGFSGAGTGANTPMGGPGAVDTRAADFQPGTGDERYGQPSWTVRPQEQRYLPVNIR